MVDTGIALVLFGVSCMVGFQVEPSGYRPFDVYGCLLTGAVCLPLTCRRRAPLTVLSITCAAYVVFLVAGYEPIPNIWGPVLAFFPVVVLRPFRIAVAAAVFTGLVILYSGLRVPRLPIEITGAQAVVLTGVTFALGRRTRKLAQRNEQLAAVTAQLRQEQHEQTERAIAEERLRIARELHDMIAHHMSVISVQSGLAGYVFDSDPATARAALDTVAGTSREALEEMRNLLAVLRVEPQDADDPAPRLADLDTLVDRVRQAGLSVHLTVTGRSRPLPAGLELCAYRVIQEALTNTLKHAGPGRAELVVRYLPNRLTVRVTDDGPGPAAGHTAGHGLIGMRERARLYRGTLTVGTGPEGGFQVELTLPTPWLMPAGGTTAGRIRGGE